MTAITKTTVGLNLTRDSTSGAQNPLISYVALGTSGTAPTAADTQLGAEVFRKATTTYTSGATGEMLTSVYIAPGDVVGTVIAEIGFFSGNATALANSGVLIAHGLYSHTKTNLESIILQLDEIFS